MKFRTVCKNRSILSTKINIHILYKFLLDSYTYTGEYTSTYVYDSLALSVSDGQFEAGPIDVPIRIRATKGRSDPRVQSQSSLHAELLDRSRPDSDTLLSDAASEPWGNLLLLLRMFKVYLRYDRYNLKN